uniref:Uncharacterized protein n=1 Tax=Arundo donax TaxID=35708 RepID=A0A0A9FB06_ARUDO
MSTCSNKSISSFIDRNFFNNIKQKLHSSIN